MIRIHCSVVIQNNLMINIFWEPSHKLKIISQNVLVSHCKRDFLNSLVKSNLKVDHSVLDQIYISI